MALVLADRVKETTTTTGTGALSLASSATGFQSFADGVGDGNTTYYAVSSALGSEYEVGIGTYNQTADELSRDTVLASSNGGSLVNFSSGTKDVYVVYPAGKSVYKDESGVVPPTTFASLSGDLTGDVTGNADTASALETARTIALSGDVTGSTSFDGSGNVAISTSLDGGNADTLDGEQGTYYLNYNNFTNTPTLYTSSNFDTDFSSKSTSDLSEGTNLYYTDARARSSVSVSGDLSYNASTGVFSFTERTDSEVRGLFSASGDLAYSSTTGEFSVTTYKSSDFDSDFSGKDTDDLSEGISNLYYTDTRARGALSASGDLSYDSVAGEFSVTTYKSSDFDSDFSGKDTDDLSEGTNLYYTDARARSSVSASGDISYDSATGVFSFTERTDSEVRGLFSASGDLGYNSTTGEFSVTTYKSSDFDTDFSSKSTSDLSEGTNLYYTDSRARSALSASGDLSYDSATGVFSYSERSDSDIRNLFSAAGDLSYDSATGEFSVTVPAGYDSSDFDTDFSSKSTSDLSEGANLYYTDARVDARIGDGTLTVSGGSGLTGSGTFDANQSTNSSVTLSHADTSSVSDLTASDRVYVTGITFDTYGHVTGYETQDEGAVDVSTIPFFTTDGVRSDISLVSGTEIPFFLADGSQNNIPLAA